MQRDAECVRPSGALHFPLAQSDPHSNPHPKRETPELCSEESSSGVMPHTLQGGREVLRSQPPSPALSLHVSLYVTPCLGAPASLWEHTAEPFCTQRWAFLNRGRVWTLMVAFRVSRAGPIISSPTRSSKGPLYPFYHASGPKPYICGGLTGLAPPG